MNRLLSKIIIVAGVIFIFNSIAFATGPATVYKVRIAKFELFNGTNWIPIFEGTSGTLDIAAVSGGSAAGSFCAGLSVPDGTYTQVRVTPSPIFNISGNDGASYTTAANGVGGGSVVGTATQQAECAVTLTGGAIPGPQTTDFSATPITVKDGIADHKVRVSFDVSNAIQLQGGELYPAVPVVTVSAQ